MTVKKTGIVQWNKNGDHPLDGVGETLVDPVTGEPYTRLEGAVVRFFRHPDIAGDDICAECGQRFHDHGWIDSRMNGHRVCPGDFIRVGADGFYPTKVPS